MLVAILFGLGIGLSVGALGGGGSVLAVPVLVYVLGQGVAEATTASLAVVAGGAVAGTVAHARAGRVCWRHAGSFTAAAIPGVAAGTLAAEAVDESVLLLAFALVMLAAARATWRKGEEQHDAAEPTGDACPPLRAPHDLLAGVALGALTGFLGVGGGFLIVPTLVLALAFTMRTAIGTSLAIITATSLAGLAAHLVAGRTLDVDLTTAMTVACAAGATVGAAMVARLPQCALARSFAVLVAGVGVSIVAGVVAGSSP